jgi:hypothetical protein
MGKLDYKDFCFRPSPLSARGRLKSIPPARQQFFGKIDIFLSQDNRKLINVESHEDFFRVWFLEG